MPSVTNTFYGGTYKQIIVFKGCFLTVGELCAIYRGFDLTPKVSKISGRNLFASSQD